jgi:hypothetical protein
LTPKYSPAEFEIQTSDWEKQRNENVTLLAHIETRIFWGPKSALASDIFWFSGSELCCLCFALKAVMFDSNRGLEFAKSASK